MRTDMHLFIELLWGMTEKELRARYKYTIFGFIWLVANPLLQMLIIGFIFTYFMKEPIQYYYYHLFIGLLVWSFFSTSLTKTTPSIVFERSLIKKAAFPRVVVPLSIIVSSAVHFLLALLLLLIPIFFLHTVSLMTIPILFCASAMLLIFTTGICLLTSALNVRYRDVNFFVQALLLVWFYATPIVYSLMQMPDRLLWLWRFNPLTTVMQLYQYALLNAPAPGIAMITCNSIVIAIIFFLGVRTFILESKTFDDWV